MVDDHHRLPRSTASVDKRRYTRRRTAHHTRQIREGVVADLNIEIGQVLRVEMMT
jgi:hypothetical protein